MSYKPPLTVDTNELIGTLLQHWRADDPLELHQNPEKVVEDLGYDAEREETIAEVKCLESPTSRLSLILHYLKTAEQLNRELTGVIDLQRLDKDTGLLTVILYADERDIEQYQRGYFTKNSVYHWADDRFNIQIGPWAPAEYRAESIARAAPGVKMKSPALIDNEVEKLEVLVALLAMQVASGAGGKFGTRKKPNCRQIAAQICAEMESQRIDIKGFSDKRLRDKLGKSLKTAGRYTTGK